MCDNCARLNDIKTLCGVCRSKKCYGCGEYGICEYYCDSCANYKDGTIAQLEAKIKNLERRIDDLTQPKERSIVDIAYDY